MGPEQEKFGEEPTVQKPIQFKEIRPLQESDKENCLVAESPLQTSILSQELIGQVQPLFTRQDITMPPNIDFYGYQYLDPLTGKTYTIATEFRASSIPMAHAKDLGYFRTEAANIEAQKRLEEARQQGDEHLAFVGIIGLLEMVDRIEKNPTFTFNKFIYNPERNELLPPRPDGSEMDKEAQAITAELGNPAIAQSVETFREGLILGRRIGAEIPLETLGMINLEPEVAKNLGLKPESLQEKLDSWVQNNQDSVSSYLEKVQTAIQLGDSPLEKRLQVLVDYRSPTRLKLCTALKESFERVTEERK